MSELNHQPLRDKVDPRHTALVVIDVQRDFCAPDGFRAKRGGDLSMVDPMIDALLPTIKAAQTAKVSVLYTQQIYDWGKLTDLQKEQYDLDGKLVICDPATGGHELYRVKPPTSDLYVKYNYDAFSNQEFKDRLESEGIKTLVITGLDSFYCVETAIRNGFDLGYKIVVPKDLIACSGKHREMHERTLWLVEKTYGVVTDAETLQTLWNGYYRSMK